MSSLRLPIAICVILFLKVARGSVGHHPGISYTHAVPYNVPPFAASVNIFQKHFGHQALLAAPHFAPHPIPPAPIFPGPLFGHSKLAALPNFVPGAPLPLHSHLAPFVDGPIPHALPAPFPHALPQLAHPIGGPILAPHFISEPAPRALPPPHLTSAVGGPIPPHLVTGPTPHALPPPHFSPVLEGPIHHGHIPHGAAPLWKR